MSTRVLPDFEILIPRDVDEAVKTLAEYGAKAMVMAGGTDVLVMMKYNLRSEYVMSVSGIDGLDPLNFDPVEGLRIGATTTVAQIVDSQEVEAHYPALWQAASVLGSPQIRNSATVIGNLLRASPAGDCSCAILALGGTLVFQSVEGRRDVSIDDVWLSYGVTARKPNELAVELRLPAPKPGTRSAFSRMTRTSEDLSKLNASAGLVMDGKVCRSARLAMGCVGPTTIRLPSVEALLIGKTVDAAVLKTVQDAVGACINPIDDKRSSAEYRRAVAGVLLRRTIVQALDV
jgi:CO/xanthine dehydrogenase FAD-binding subunit